MAKTFKKQLLRFGSYVHPNNPARQMVIDRQVAESLKANFERGIIDKVPAPWTHTDDASANTGFVKGLELSDDGVDMIVEFSNDQAADMADKKLIPGVSAGLDFDYLDKRTGERVGPTLLHAALVNHPYIKGMRDFEPLHGAIGLSEGGVEEVLVLSEHEEEDTVPDLTKEDIYEVLKEVHGVDVPALESRVTELEESTTGVDPEMEAKAALSDDIIAVLMGDKVMLSEGDDPVDAVKKIVVELSELKTEKLERDAGDSVQVLLSEGKITPAQKDMYLGLAKQGVLTEAFVDAMPKVVDLSERGHDGGLKPGSEDEAATLKAEIERISTEAGYRSKK